MNLVALKPSTKQLVYDLVTQAGVDTRGWANYERPTVPASNPRYCYNWSFEAPDRVVLCLWFEEMRQEGDVIFQALNYRDIAAGLRRWNATQRKRAAAMDHAIQLARIRHLPVRVIIVDGSRRGDAIDETRSRVERRLLDPEPWHVAAYDDDGKCRLQRGPESSTLEAFTSEEITIAGTFAEGAHSQITARTRERSNHLRELAREYYAKQSPDGRLHCAVCNWAPPPGLALSGPIVEIHHEVAVSSLPVEGQTLTFAEAIKLLTPLCPTCHRISHAKPCGGTFTLGELRRIHQTT